MVLERILDSCAEGKYQLFVLDTAVFFNQQRISFNCSPQIRNFGILYADSRYSQIRAVEGFRLIRRSYFNCKPWYAAHGEL